MIYRLIDRSDVSKNVVRAVYFDGTNHHEVLALLNEVNVEQVVRLDFPEPYVLRVLINTISGQSVDYNPGDWIDAPSGQKQTEAFIRSTYYLADTELAL